MKVRVTCETDTSLQQISNMMDKVGEEVTLRLPCPITLIEVIPLDDEKLIEVKQAAVTNEKKESVDHPDHYNGHPKGIECIDVIEDANIFNLATSIKYLWRVTFGSKDNDTEDLEKAIWYIQRELLRRNANDA